MVDAASIDDQIFIENVCPFLVSSGKISNLDYKYISKTSGLH